MTYNPISGPIGRLFPHPAKSLAKNLRGTDDAEQGRAGVRERWAITSADVRAVRQLDLMAVPDGASLLDLRAVSRLRPFRAL